VLEFLGLTPHDDFYESDLEQALITHLQKFLLELGRGFSYVTVREEGDENERKNNPAISN
jgi:predicted nuclease of restriction endonuclease-like (RecB) superfamily